MQSALRPEVRAILGTVLQGNGAQYFIQDVIGEGGQGWVFRASYDDVEGFPVVVKVLRPDSATKDALDRFRREAEILRRLSQQNPSPHIVRFFDHGEAAFPLSEGAVPSGRTMLPYTVLEYVHGEALQAVVDRQRGQGIGIGRSRRIAREIAKALEIVHAQGIVHRDLKPSNILLASEAGREVAKVTDFGLVKVIDLRNTATQALAGVSLSYAPPEQYEPGNPRVGPATDVFSFAAIVFELMCGTEAFPASKQNPFEALRLIATSKRPKLAERVSSLPAGLRERGDLIHRLDMELEHALAPEPGDRPQTLEAFWDRVEPILREADGKLPNEPTGKVAAYVTVQQSQPTLPNDAFPTPSPSAPRASNPVASYGFTPQSAQPTMTAGSASDPSDARAWTFRLVANGTPGAAVRDAIIDDVLGSVTTIGASGVVRWTQAGFTPIPLGHGVLLSEPRCIARLPQGMVVIAGERGLIAFLHGTSLSDLRRFPDGDVTFHAIAADASGSRILAVGERVSRGHAIAVELTPSGFRRTFDLADLGPLRSAAHLDAGVSYACGDGGALVRIDDRGLTRIPWERTGHLRAIVARQAATTQVFAVGTGGHALAIDATPPPSPPVVIEKVMTTQDLLGACLGDAGVAWAVSAHARVVRRDGGGTWRRISGDLPSTADLVRVGAAGDRVLIVANDAAILEGTLGRR
ncbi:MAG: serine/threonine-protein kinase [Polyangiales bacterium]